MDVLFRGTTYSYVNDLRGVSLKRTASAIAVVTTFLHGAFVAGAVAGKIGPAGLLQTVTGTTTLVTTTVTTAPPPTVTTNPGGQQRLIVCHHTGSRKNPDVTLRIPAQAWRAHQRHGDTLGPCGTERNQTIHSKNAHAKKFHKQAKVKAQRQQRGKGQKGNKGNKGNQGNKGKGKGRG